MDAYEKSAKIFHTLNELVEIIQLRADAKVKANTTNKADRSELFNQVTETYDQRLEVLMQEYLAARSQPR